MKVVFLVLIVLSSSAIAQTCGGPTYPCALRQTNAQLTVIPLPDPLPSVGGLVGANQCVTLPVYNTTVCRCTDVNTDPTNTRNHSYEVTDTGGDNVIQWSSNQRELRVNRGSTGSTGVVGFDPATNNCTVMNLGSVTPEGAAWSLNDPNVQYSHASGGLAVTKMQFDYTKPLAAPTVTTLFNFTNVCPLLSGLSISYLTQIVTQDDDLFSMAFGVNGEHQDQAQYIVSYQISSDRCWLLNTLTGQVERSGCAGPVNLGTVSTFYPFTIHSMDQSPSGTLEVGVGVTCTGCPSPHGPFFYYPRTTHMDLLTTRPLGGHNTMGFKTWVDATAAPKLASRPFAGFSPVTFISSNTGVNWPLPLDTHYGWQNDDPNDTAPICGTEASVKQPQPFAVTSPLEQEVSCVDPADGTFIRLAPTFSSGVPNPDNFRTEYAIMANGKLGYIAFSSDWEGTLGNTDGVTSSCTLGSGPPNECRSDVFILIGR